MFILLFLGFSGLIEASFLFSFLDFPVEKKKKKKLLALRQWQIFSSPLATDIK